ncbi:MAG: orotidine-5'-phosphate decarboxylase [Candidatus Omnitrophota bacterium]
MKAKLIVALDVENLEKAEQLATLLYPTVELFKIGMQLFTACGLKAVEMVGQKGAKVFLDLKFHDIPKTVFSGVTSGTGLSCEPVFVSNTFPNIEQEVRASICFPVFMMTVHASGGQEMMQFAARAAAERAKKLNIDRPKIVGVTVLTSNEQAEDTQKKVVAMALSAKEAGLDGVVCSVWEAAAVRRECGKDFIIVTPGIRAQGGDQGDQKRVATPADAIAAGSDFMVVGRPIVEASDPLKAAKEFIRE